MKKKCLLLLMLTLMTVISEAYATVFFDHGGVENIDYTIDDTVYVDAQLAPNPGTIVNILSGGEITGEYTRLYNNSRLNINGGKVAGIWAFDDSTVNVYDGEVSWYISLSNNTKLNVHGGAITQNISAGSNMVEIWGGQLLGDIITYDGPVKLYGIFDQGYGTFTGSGEITGTLSNNDSIGVSYSTYNSGSIILAPIPEPTVICLLTLGGWFVRKHR